MTAFEGDSQTFTITLPLVIRAMIADDLRKLEWYGQFKHFRNLFARSYHDQGTGRRHLLIADMHGFPVGRLFILFQSRNQVIADGSSRAYLYSFAVMDLFQGRGIGSKLIEAAEVVMKARRFEWATLAVAQDNEGALRLYQRHGYHIFAEDEGRWRYVDHRGITRHVYEPCWMLEKQLLP